MMQNTKQALRPLYSPPPLAINTLVVRQRVGEQSGRDGHDVVRGEGLNRAQHLLARLLVGELGQLGVKAALGRRRESSVGELG